MRKKYDTDLTDEQWAEIAPLFVGMRKYKWEKRELLDAVFYLVDSGCKWRQLPHDFPPAFTVHSFYRRARLSGLWDKILEHMVKVTRKNAGLDENPTVALVDSQTVQNVSASEQSGYDAGKKKKGIKRQIVTDKIGCLLAIVTHKANQHDTKIGIWAAAFAFFVYSTIKKFCADGGYRKTFIAQVKEYLGLEVEISHKITPHGWQVISPRWVVERTLAWLNNSRRLSKNYEYSMSSAEAMVKISHIHTLIKRL